MRLAALRDRTRFCCMTESIGPAFNQPHVQGILGLAFSNFTSRSCLGGKKRPVARLILTQQSNLPLRFFCAKAKLSFCN